MKSLAHINRKKGHPKTEDISVSEKFARLEVGAASVRRSVATIREAIRRGEVPAVRDGRLVLVDLAALQRRFTPRPIVPLHSKNV
jgi:excisionase family DNA binding protein